MLFNVTLKLFFTYLALGFIIVVNCIIGIAVVVVVVIVVIVVVVAVDVASEIVVGLLNIYLH